MNRLLNVSDTFDTGLDSLVSKLLRLLEIEAKMARVAAKARSASMNYAFSYIDTSWAIELGQVGGHHERRHFRCAN